jgi:hypothetical protein
MAGADLFCCLVAGGWFGLRVKYCWLVAGKPNEQGESLSPSEFIQKSYNFWKRVRL